ncbi:hypothetical protein HAX54_048303 [Datura stramonium]|uniref:Uncharacterized protein n=1 Tax=Datura stramonium TaxID=4076 RepID=A0ABS8SU45_DATST|nr:hypothetical protein [Datura stramonium]
MDSSTHLLFLAASGAILTVENLKKRQITYVGASYAIVKVKMWTTSSYIVRWQLNCGVRFEMSRAVKGDVGHIFLSIFQRCAGAGHLGEDILQYSQELERKLDEDEERRAYLMDMGIRALRRYFFLITFRSYLYCTSPAEITFSEWMDARPELGHLCNNLRI